jgi:plasmid maintenance system antidote protein VapI
MSDIQLRLHPGQMIFQSMRSYGMTTDMLSERSGIDEPTIRKMIMGQELLTEELLGKMAFIFDYDPKLLLESQQAYFDQWNDLINGWNEAYLTN